MVAEVQEGLMRWTFRWSDARVPPTASSLTTGHLLLEVGDDVIWKGVEFEWNWIELLEWLTESWRWLVGEDGLPFDAAPPDLFGLRRQARSIGEQELFWDFEQTHDMSESLRGAWTSSSLLIWREGLIGHFLTEDSHYQEPWGRTRVALAGLGQQICDRLTSALGEDARADKANAAWNARGSITVSAALPLLGLSETSSDLIIPLLAGNDLDIDSLAMNEIFAAAKMSAALPPSSVAAVIEHLQTMPHIDRARIDEIAESVERRLEFAGDALPHDEGYEIARVFRDELGMESHERFEPEVWLRDTGIHLSEADLGRDVRAIAAWGQHHGPGIVINAKKSGLRILGTTRTDLAHEICHLLVDRHAALPVADVLAGRSRRTVEKRANAFAAEVLLPREEATNVLQNAHTESDAWRAVRSLSSLFQVGHEVVARQVLNSELRLTDDVRATLTSIANRKKPFSSRD